MTGISERRSHRRIRVGIIGSALTAAVALFCGSLVSAPAADAYPAPYGCCSGGAMYDVVNASGGVYWRWGPYNNDYQAISGYGVYNGYQIYLGCYQFGDPVGPYGDRLWYWGEIWSPTNYVGDGMGWVNDHYLDTPGTAANPQPVTAPC